MNNLPAGAEKDSRAPFNQPDVPELECPECGSALINSEISGSGKYEWWEHECLVCGYKWSEEPDWDSMKGGPDYE